MNFYVYIYFDPRVPGDYIIEGVKYNFKPVYIGKGKGNRCTTHLSSRRKKSYKLHNLIKHLRNSQIEPIYSIVKEFQSESDAHLYEQRLISEIGREDRGVGPLFNLTDGGEGIVGLQCTDDNREVKRKNTTAFWNSLSIEERKLIGQQSLKNRNIVNVQNGAKAGAVTRMSKPKHVRADIERKRFVKWQQNYCNTAEKIDLRSKRCSVASNNRMFYYLSILFIDTGITKSYFLKDLIKRGWGKDALEWRIKGKMPLNKPYKTIDGTISILSVTKSKISDIS
jgi:hypothetical protein